MMKLSSFSLGALALVLLSLWYVSDDAETVKSEAGQPMAETVQLLFPASMASPRLEAATSISPGSPGSGTKLTSQSASVSFREPNCRRYQNPPAMAAFYQRREALNQSRLKNGLEGIEVPLTPEEIVVILPQLRAKIGELQGLVDAGHCNHVNRIFGHVQDLGIEVGVLGAESVQVLTTLAQQQADNAAPKVEALLNRGCFGTAGFIFRTAIQFAAETLGTASSFGYERLADWIKREEEREEGQVGAQFISLTEGEAESAQVQREAYLKNVELFKAVRIRQFGCPIHG